MANGRILTKDLDSRIKAMEDKLAEIVNRLSHLDDHVHHAARRAEEVAEQMHHAATHNGNGGGAAASEPAPSGKLAELEAVVSGLNERVDKITQTLVTQASRWT